MESIMKFIKYIIPLLVVASSASAQIGQETGFDRQLRTRDDQAVREFVESKENIDVKKKSNNLDISGDVRFEWQRVQERGVVLFEKEDSSSCNSSGSSSEEKRKIYKHSRNLRGGHHVGTDRLPLSVNNFDVEFNLKLKYTFENAWAAAHLQFDNPAGVRAGVFCRSDEPVFNYSGSEIESELKRDTRRALKGSGIANLINLKRAFIGYNIWADGEERIDIEVGRRKFDDVFDSEVQFSNRFDGILLKYASAIENVADFYANTGVFVIDQRTNHFGYVTELGFLNICDTALDLRYSFIDWQKHGRNRCKHRNPRGTDFANSQISFSYTITPELFCQDEFPIEFYGGFLVNHAARKNHFTHNKKENLAGYAGVLFGKSNKKGDWTIDVEYIYIQAQAVPDYDVGSIGRGNILNEGLFDIVVDPVSDNFAYFPRRGNGNLSGIRAEFLYLLTDNLSIDTIFEYSTAASRKIGGRHDYTCFEIEAIYAF